MTTVLVTDADQRAALAAVRSLGRSGYRVVVCSAVSRPLAGASRYVRSTSLVPDPLRDPQAFAQAVSGVIRATDADVLLPITEPSILAILAERKLFDSTVIPFPSYLQFAGLSDKAALITRAAQIGINVPVQHVLAGPGDEADETIRFPVVAKPSRSVSGVDRARVKLAVRHAADRSELARALDAYPLAAYPVLIQERIVGPGIGIFLLRWEGRTLAAMAHRRLREKPPSGGVSVLRETIPAPADLVAQSERLLQLYDWSGVAMVEYKVDAATGKAYLMEVNARLWGSLQLAIDAGVDFPTLLVDAACGRRVEPVTTYRLVRSHWWWGEIDHLLARWSRHGTGDENLPGRLRTTVDILRPWRRNSREEVFRWDDPRPFFQETRDWFRGLVA